MGLRSVYINPGPRVKEVLWAEYRPLTEAYSICGTSWEATFDEHGADRISSKRGQLPRTAQQIRWRIDEKPGQERRSNSGGAPVQVCSDRTSQSMAGT
jgi:hypothetical protein